METEAEKAKAFDDPTSLLTLATLGKGAAEELFQQALAKVVENILDPNCEMKGKRQVALLIDFEVGEERTTLNHTVTATVKLAKHLGMGGTIFLFDRKSGPIATVYNVEQQQLAFSEQDKPRVLHPAAGQATGS